MSKSPKKIELILEEIGGILTDEQKLCLQRHFKQQSLRYHARQH
jgi:hypothetical protein